MDSKLKDPALCTTNAETIREANHEGRRADELRHELRIHQVELETQNEELRKAYVDLEESRNQYQELYNFAPAGYLLLTLDGLIQEANQTAALLFGLDRQTLLQRKFSSWVAPEDGDLWYLFFRDIVKRGVSHIIELTLKRSDGSRFVVLLDSLCKTSVDQGLMLNVSIIDITERKKMALLLLQSEVTLKAILDSSIDGIAVANTESLRFTFFNRAFCQMLGYSRDEIENLTVDQLHDSADIPRLKSEIKKLSQGAAGLIKELPLVRKDGSKFLADDSASCLELDGKPHIMGVFRDVSERKIQENKIMRLNQIYAALAKTNRIARNTQSEAALFKEICHIAVEQCGVNMAWIGVNKPGSERLQPVASQGEHFGYLDGIAVFVDANSPEGRGPAGTAFCEARTVIVPDIQDVATTLPWRERISRFGNWRSIAAFPILRNGQRYGVFSLYHSENDNFDEPVVNLFADMVADIGFALDVLDKENARQAAIRERNEKERLLRKSAEEIEQFYNCAPCGFHSLNKDGTICRINNTELVWLGFTRSEVVGKMHWTALLTPEGVEVFRQSFPTLIKQGFIHNLEVEIVRKDGTTFHGLISATAIYDANGDYLMSRSTVLDITQRKLTEAKIDEHLDELAHVTRLGLMGEMASGIAHEINQPLTAVSAYTQASLNLINAKNPDLEALSAVLSKTQQQALRAGQIIHQMRMFVKSDIKLRSNTDINTLITDAANLCVSELKQNNIKPALNLGDNLPYVWVCAIQIEQVIINLIRNSIDALRDLPAHQQRLLSISSQLTPNKYIQVKVKDNGIGIDQQQKQKILMPFYTTKNEGMGMGLSISRSLIEAHEGLFNFDSEAGKGTTFYFTLPAVQ